MLRQRPGKYVTQSYVSKMTFRVQRGDIYQVTLRVQKALVIKWFEISFSRVGLPFKNVKIPLKRFPQNRNEIACSFLVSAVQIDIHTCITYRSIPPPTLSQYQSTHSH